MPKKQAVYVDNKLFGSVVGAAKFLKTPVESLRAALRGKKAAIYKGLVVEKTDEQVKKTKVSNGRTTRIPVIVDGVAYNSLIEAERTLGFPQSVLYSAIRNRKYKNHKVEPLYPSTINKLKSRKQREGTKVYCKTIDKTFDSIEDAARFANADGWTMGKKMEASGGFVDKKGNEYVRLKPMDTKNTYNDTGKTIKKERQSKQRTVVEKPQAEKQDVPQVVKDAINEKIIALLKDKGLYEDIVALLKYGGFTSVKFDMNKND